MANIIAFVQAHQVVLAAAGVGILDLIIALIPSLAANGLVHALLLFLQGKSQIVAPVAPVVGSISPPPAS